VKGVEELKGGREGERRSGGGDTQNDSE